MGIINVAGTAFERLGGSNLLPDAERLCVEAQEALGLDDFGSNFLPEALNVLVNAFQSEGNLTPFGTFATRRRILIALKTRLKVVNELRWAPEILDVPILRPLAIAGLPRSGTTFLHHLLAQDPEARWLSTWEALSPAREPGEVVRSYDTREKRARRLKIPVAFASRILPGIKAMHLVEIFGPCEDLPLLENSFLTDLVLMPLYRSWYLERADHLLDATYSDFLEQLRLVTWLSPSNRHWVLKTPSHSYGLPQLTRVLPNVAIVQVHRDPIEVLNSMCSMSQLIRAVVAPSRQHTILAECVDWLVESIRRVNQFRGTTAGQRILDLRYLDLRRDPLAAIRNIYDHFGYHYGPRFDDRAKRWLALNPQNKRGRHLYDLAPLPLSPLQRATLDEYRATFLTDR